MDATVDAMRQQIQELTTALAALQATVATVAAGSTAGTATLTAPSSAPTWLEPRSMTREMDLVVHPNPVLTVTPEGSAVVPNYSGARKAPDQPVFHGKDFKEFLLKYHRWSLLAGLDGAPDDVRRTWFMAALGTEVTEVAEALYSNTYTFDELVRGLGRIYPTHMSDFSLRHEVQGVPTLSAHPTLADVERLVMNLERLWSLMTAGAYSDQERMVVLMQKIYATTWKRLREHATGRPTLTPKTGSRKQFEA